MSIDYYAVPTEEIAMARAILDRDVPEEVDELDKEHLARALQEAVPEFVRFAKDWEKIAKRERMTAEEARLQFSSIVLNWDREGHIQVDVDDYAVGVSHGFGGGELQMEVLERVLRVLAGEGLSIYDPQYDEMLAPDQY